MREESMKAKRKSEYEDDTLPEYDFTGAVRGQYYESYRQGTNVVLLDPDVAAVFRDAAVVNEALRLLISVAEAKALSPRSATLAPQPLKKRQSAARRRRSGSRPKPVRAIGV